MDLMSPIESMMLLAESPGHPMHVAGLQLFQTPDGAGPEFAGDYYRSLRSRDDVAPLFSRYPASLPTGLNLGWSSAGDIDLDYHVRHSALPGPGRVRELLELTSRLHSTMLDRHRPLWETHVIEGLADGRFAVYTKIHHALVDGVSAINLLQGALSADALDEHIRAPWSTVAGAEDHADGPSRLQALAQAVRSIPRLGSSTLGLARSALFEQQLTLPFRAPRTMFNVPIGGARRCAAQSWPMQRIKDVKNAAGVTVNDVVLAMCAGALRAYLCEQHALPEKPLVAMVPVSLRTADEGPGGNAVTAVLANLATHVDDPALRLATINSSMRKSKAVLAGLPRAQAIAMGMMLLSPVVLGGVTGGMATPPPFNVCVSNVPGARNPLYANGARLQGSYPMSIAANGQALNITLVGSGDSLDFGLVGCRRAVPHLQRLLGHLETSLKDLEQAVGL
ncbi:diacylglycerol O-acyltransferase [Mycobacterium gordonae]|uniref:Diacylglycerol O-acyltransferase n=1 Tax=Mycobacterium gordonae TaxID=1778 RepID=A0A0Q2X9J3_MYCGO|nr:MULTISPECIES: wax ester/triacylglycerol synthase family O-acyltransferase [Mycobacterium]KQH77876.1 diacylglycerol O-acyltransferase [Mycobacterium gordonae]MDP7730095.1 wax ester/triacylglycerol synthase family O-acyltransferase [Mycobacterium sp. TY813]